MQLLMQSSSRLNILILIFVLMCFNDFELLSGIDFCMHLFMILENNPHVGVNVGVGGGVIAPLAGEGVGVDEA